MALTILTSKWKFQTRESGTDTAARGTDCVVTGNNVFDLPAYVTRVHIVGTFGGSCQNFILHIAGRGIVNEILGTCGVATTGARYDGTHQLVSPGGLVEVLNSSGINWVVEEVR